jgi:hypothetical protein
MVLSNRLRKIMEPPAPPKPRRTYKKRRPKADGQTTAATR